MEILWNIDDETICSYCGESEKPVRGYSNGKIFYRMCYSCWNAQQDGCILSSVDWIEDHAFVFRPKKGTTKIGTSQGDITD